MHWIIEVLSSSIVIVCCCTEKHKQEERGRSEKLHLVSNSIYGEQQTNDDETHPEKNLHNKLMMKF